MTDFATLGLNILGTVIAMAFLLWLLGVFINLMEAVRELFVKWGWVDD